MSETVHYKGVATKITPPKGKTLIDVAKDILKDRNKEMPDYFDNAVDFLVDEFYNEFFYRAKTKTLYSITKVERDPDADIIEANEKEDGTIEYELRYYNGGAGFNECLDDAFDNLHDF